MALVTERDELLAKLAAQDAELAALRATAGRQHEQVVVLPTGDLYRIPADPRNPIMRPDTIDLRSDPKPQPTVAAAQALEAAVANILTGGKAPE